jgi:hypothetical protein
MRRAEKPSSTATPPVRRTTEAVIAQYIRDLAASAAPSS